MVQNKRVTKRKPADPTKKAIDYIGTKELRATPMTRGAYNKFRGWDIPADENPKDEGYLVIYPEENQPGGKPYISWSPKAVFEAAYRQMNNLTFGDAVFLMKKGLKLARAGWNGKGMWVIYVPGQKKVTLVEGTPYQQALGKRKTVEILPHFDMWTVNSAGRRAMLPGWLASQSDIDANDWCVVK